MKEIKRLKFNEPHKFKKKANEDQFKFNQKLSKTLDSAKSVAEHSRLEKVKSDLEEDIFQSGFWSPGQTTRRLAQRTGGSTEDDGALSQSKWNCCGLQQCFPQMEAVCT